MEMKATITGLANRSDLNGRLVNINRFNHETNRYTVTVENDDEEEVWDDADGEEVLAVKPNNLLFPNGTQVEINGLVNANQYNGKQATIISFSGNDGRYSVQLVDDNGTTTTINVKPTNFIVTGIPRHTTGIEKRNSADDSGLKSLRPPSRRDNSPDDEKQKHQQQPKEVPWTLSNEEHHDVDPSRQKQYEDKMMTMQEISSKETSQQPELALFPTVTEEQTTASHDDTKMKEYNKQMIKEDGEKKKTSNKKYPQLAAAHVPMEEDDGEILRGEQHKTSLQAGRDIETGPYQDVYASTTAERATISGTNDDGVEHDERIYPGAVPMPGPVSSVTAASRGANQASVAPSSISSLTDEENRAAAAATAAGSSEITAELVNDDDIASRILRQVREEVRHEVRQEVRQEMVDSAVVATGVVAATADDNGDPTTGVESGAASASFDNNDDNKMKEEESWCQRKWKLVATVSGLLLVVVVVIVVVVLLTGGGSGDGNDDRSPTNPATLPPTPNQIDLSGYGYDHVWDVATGSFLQPLVKNPDGTLEYDDSDSSYHENVTTVEECAQICKLEGAMAGAWDPNPNPQPGETQGPECFCENQFNRNAASYYCLEPCHVEPGYHFSTVPRSSFDLCENSLCQIESFTEWCESVSFDKDACDDKLASDPSFTNPPSVKSPIASPTLSPTTSEPTAIPTTNPTAEPTTTEPTKEPTGKPTDATTPAPTSSTREDIITAVTGFSGATRTLDNNEQSIYIGVQIATLADQTGLPENNISVEIVEQMFGPDPSQFRREQRKLPTSVGDWDRFLQDVDDDQDILLVITTTEFNNVPDENFNASAAVQTALGGDVFIENLISSGIPVTSVILVETGIEDCGLCTTPTSTPSTKAPSKAPTTFPPTPKPTTTEATIFCDENSDCELGKCAFESYTGSAKLVCCPSGTSEFIYDWEYDIYPKSDDGNFCRGQPVGASCPMNSLCESGNCIFGKCEDSLRGTGGACEENADCDSYVCVSGECKATAVEASEECDDNADCALGKCAFESYTATAKLVCCPSGTSEFIYDWEYDPYPKSDDGNFCRGQPADAWCPDNSLCESNNCINRKCVDELREAGEACEENADCDSYVCVSRVCKAAVLDASEECDDNNDCALGKCAYESYLGSAKLVCCPSGTSEFIYDWEYDPYPKSDDGHFCLGQPAGASCPDNSLCESGNCIDRKCADTLREAGEACEENADCDSRVCVSRVCKAAPLDGSEECDDDKDCVLGKCAYESYLGSAKLVCCPSGTSEFIYDWEYDPYPKSDDGNFCLGQPAGASCPMNSLCESGNCIFGKCEESLRGTGEACEENADCDSQVCVSGECKGGVQKASEECDDNADCDLGKCAYETYTASAKVVCCPSGTSEFIYDWEYDLYPKSDDGNFCRGQPAGASCPANNLCASNECISNVCS